MAVSFKPDHLLDVRVKYLAFLAPEQLECQWAVLDFEAHQQLLHILELVGQVQVSAKYGFQSTEVQQLLHSGAP